MKSKLPITVVGKSQCSLGCGGCSATSNSEFNNNAISALSSEGNQSGIKGSEIGVLEGGSSPSTPYTFSSILKAEEQVLPTLMADGSRKWLSPKLSEGKWWNRRRWVAYGLIVFFVTLPHFRLNGRPLVLLDIIKRQFTILGHTFYPTDTPLVAILLLMAMFSIMFVTAVGGRIWCGWGCPQTVYLEFLFRPIDRFFAGVGKRLPGLGEPLRILTYVVCSLFIAHTGLSYFVGTDRLAQWVRLSPLEHPTAFLVMGVVTGGLLFDFLFFREQFCMIACPYGRFQSVMLDRRSLIVAYDKNRGEPRGKGKRQEDNKLGDCLDCGRCTAVCPTGIDIRNGLQMECIHCTQCIDACDDVMKHAGFAPGLVRYSSQEELAGKKFGWLRARTVIYPTLIGVLSLLFLFVLSTKFAMDVRVLRAPGAPYTALGNNDIQNNFRLRIVNRSQITQAYTMEIKKPENATIEWSSGKPLQLEPGETIIAPVAIHFHNRLSAGTGHAAAEVRVEDNSGNHREVYVQLLGPR